MKLLIESGLPESLKDNVAMGPKGQVNINGIGNEICLELIEKLHAKTFLGKKLYCNGVIPLTPEKSEMQPAVSEVAVSGSSTIATTQSLLTLSSAFNPEGLNAAKNTTCVNSGSTASQPTIALNSKILSASPKAAVDDTDMAVRLILLGSFLFSF